MTYAPVNTSRLGSDEFEVLAYVVDLFTVMTYDERNEPPTRVWIAMRNTSSSRTAGQNIHLPVIPGSSQASKTRSGDALKARVTRTLTCDSAFIETGFTDRCIQPHVTP